MRRNGELPDLPGGRSAERGAGGTTLATRPSNRPEGRKSAQPLATAAPPDLLAFVRAHRTCEAARALGLSERQVSRLAAGYWPTRAADVKALQATWHDYRVRTHAPARRWVLRLVRTGGAVRHGRDVYTAAALADRVGQLVAVARAAGGALVAQTLDLPVTRLPLAVAGQAGAGVAP